MFDFLNRLAPALPFVGGPLASPALAGAVRNAGTQFMGGFNNTAQTGDAVTAESANGHAAAEQPSSFFGRLGQGIGDFGRGLSQEGLGGILDPRGMMDRQQAQRDLAGRFQVVGADHEGPRASNQVSQEEYQNIARTFSNIRMGRGDLTVNASGFDGANAEQEAGDYRQGSMDMIANMMMTDSGRRQINNLSNNVQRNDDGTSQRHLWGFGPEIHRHTEISPLFGVANGTNPDGSVKWDDPGAGNHTAANLRQDNGFAAPQGPGADRAADGTRGAGTDVNILWNPNANNIGGAGARSDIILAHEMEHAVNQSQGTQAFGTLGGTGPDQTFGNRERQAVGLTRSDSTASGSGHYPGDPDGCTENTYRSERNALGLGERWLPRERYAHLPGQAANDADLQTAWNRHNTSGNARP